jgi:hypothetical protein
MEFLISSSLFNISFVSYQRIFVWKGLRHCRMTISNLWGPSRVLRVTAQGKAENHRPWRQTTTGSLWNPTARRRLEYYTSCKPIFYIARIYQYWGEKCDRHGRVLIWADHMDRSFKEPKDDNKQHSVLWTMLNINNVAILYDYIMISLVDCCLEPLSPPSPQWHQCSWSVAFLVRRCLPCTALWKFHTRASIIEAEQTQVEWKLGYAWQDV